MGGRWPTDLPGRWPRPRKLERTDAVEGFTCGNRALDDWLKKHAFSNERAGMSTTFVCVDQPAGAVLAYYALAFGGIAHGSASPRVSRGVPRHDIPVLILARMAVRVDEQGRGLGRAMLRDALIRVERATEQVGVRCLLIHAKDEAARQFYLSCAEFEQSPTDPLHLQLLMKELRLTIQQGA